MKILIRLSLIALFLLSATNCAIAHTYGVYHGKVVDAATKKPIKGAAVLAVYYTESYGPAGSHTHYLDAQETVTDDNGEFRIPKLSVKTFKMGHSFDPHVYFTIFKPGYGCYPRHKAVKPMFVPNGSLPADQDVTIELPKVINKPIKERLRNAACLPSPSVPEEKYKKLRGLLDEEYKSIGY